jgi:peptidoglycan/xylan/chitin deacetylase (PgdA/CDA1 family)
MEEAITKFTTDYKSIQASQNFSLRQTVRKIVLDSFALLNLDRDGLSEYFNKPRVQFLYVHHIFRDEELPFRKLLDLLSKQHEFISYSDAVERLLSGNVDKPYICISSDDGFKNNLNAADILNSFGIKACFFICPSVIGIQNFDAVSKFCKERLHFPPVEFLSWHEVAKLQKYGHEIGAHTMSHANIAKLTQREMEDEIGDCYEIIRHQCGSVRHFAYPYGRYDDYNATGRKFVFNAGFKSFASAERGCHIVNTEQIIKPDELLIRRDHVILKWPLKHTLYFIARNAKRADTINNYYP